MRLAISPADAIAELVWAVSYSRAGKLPVYVNGEQARELVLDPVRAGAYVGRLAAKLDHERSLEVALGLPRKGYVGACTVLHAWISSGEQERWAGRFRPAPSIVLKMGASKERLLMWVLKHPMGVNVAEHYNRRIAYALHAPQTRSAPDGLRIPLPGTFLRRGRKRPAAVLVTRLQYEKGLEAEAVAGELRDPPDKDAWKRASR